jgi:hypothetical protein
LFEDHPDELSEMNRKFFFKKKPRPFWLEDKKYFLSIKPLGFFISLCLEAKETKQTLSQKLQRRRKKNSRLTNKT